MELRDRVCLVTGASGGIGEALAHALAGEGARVVLFARRADRLAAAVAQIGPERAVAVPGDVAHAEDLAAAVRTAVDRFGRLDILINNAGVAVVGELAGMPRELMERGWQVNVLGPILAYQAALPELRKSDRPMIVNISSGMSLRPSPGMSIYASSKAALNVISASIREEVKDLGIHVMTVHPGLIANEFGANSLFAANDEVAARRRQGSQTRSDRTSADAARDIVTAMKAGQPHLLHRGIPGPPPL